MQVARLFFIGALLFSGFSVLAQPQKDPSGDCIEFLMDKPQFEILRTKMSVASVQSQTLEMLASEKKPTKQDKVAINKLSEAVDECFKIGQSIRQEIYLPQINQLVGEYSIDLKQALADLYAGKLTYGGFSKTYTEISRKLVSGASEINAKVQAEKAARIQSEKAAQQAAKDAKDARDRRDAEQKYSRQVQERMIAENREQQERALAAQIEAQRRNAAIGYFLQNQSNQQANQQQMYNSQMQQFQRSYVPPTVTSSCVPNGMGGFNCTSR